MYKNLILHFKSFLSKNSINFNTNVEINFKQLNNINLRIFDIHCGNQCPPFTSISQTLLQIGYL